MNQHLRGIDFCIFFWGRRMMFDSEGTYFMKINWCFAFQKWWSHASINHYGPPTLAPYFVKNCGSQTCFILSKNTPWSLEIFWPRISWQGCGTHFCVDPHLCPRTQISWETLLPRWLHPRPMEKPHMFAPKRGLFTKGRWVPLFWNKLPGFVWNMSR